MFLLKSISFVLATLALTTSAYAQEPAPDGQVLTLQEAVSLASGNQPAIAAYELDARASQEAAVAARSLPDPQVSAGIQNLPITGKNALSPTEAEMTMLTIGIMREQVRRSKREVEAARLNADALVSKRQGSAKDRQIRLAVMIAWIDAVEAHSKALLLERLIDDLRTGRKVMEAGISTGNSTPALALQTDAEIGLQEGELAQTRGAEVRARAELARWIGATASRSLPDSLPLIEAPKSLPADTFRTGAHPAVQVAEAEQQVALRQVDVARQERGRDISWSVMLGIRPKYGEMVSGQVSIPLQINRRGRQDRLIGAAEARAAAARLRVEDTRRELTQQYEVARADYEGADAELAHINREAVPALESAFKVAEARYAGGDGTLEQPFAIVRRYVESTIKSVEIRAKRDRAVAKMLYVIGETGQ